MIRRRRRLLRQQATHTSARRRRRRRKCISFSFYTKLVFNDVKIDYTYLSFN